MHLNGRTNIIIAANNKYFAWSTVLLSLVHIYFALLNVGKLIINRASCGLDMVIIPFFVSLLLLIVALRVASGMIVLKPKVDKVALMICFGLFCFPEIVFGFIYGLALVEEMGLIGTLIVCAFILYYLYALLFFRRLRTA